MSPGTILDGIEIYNNAFTAYAALQREAKERVRELSNRIKSANAERLAAAAPARAKPKEPSARQRAVEYAKSSVPRPELLKQRSGAGGRSSGRQRGSRSGSEVGWGGVVAAAGVAFIAAAWSPKGMMVAAECCRLCGHIELCKHTQMFLHMHVHAPLPSMRNFVEVNTLRICWLMSFQCMHRCCRRGQHLGQTSSRMVAASWSSCSSSMSCMHSRWNRLGRSWSGR